MNRALIVIAALTIAGALIFAGAAAGEPPAGDPPPAATTKASSAATVALWKEKCANCHGEDGAGKTKMGKRMATGDMTTAEWQGARTDEQMRQAIVEGFERVEDGVPQKMDPNGDLSAEQVDALVAYSRSFGPPTAAK